MRPGASLKMGHFAQQSLDLFDPDLTVWERMQKDFPLESIGVLLLDPPNFLVPDEPTNHPDLATKEMLVETLHDFEGTMIFVSHDRTFLSGLSNRVLGGDEHDRPLVDGGTYEEYVPETGREAPGVHASR